MHTAVSIQPLKPAFKRPLCEIWFDSFESAGLKHSPGTSVDSLVARLDAEIAGGWHVWLAVDGGSLLGFLAYAPEKGYLNQLFLARSAQGRGAGKLLLDFAKLRMAAGFRLRTHADNTGAQRFYEREGLFREATERHPQYGHLTHVYRWPPMGKWDAYAGL
jgi:GNAT superfamily N-acetyltransferase